MFEALRHWRWALLGTFLSAVAACSRPAATEPESAHASGPPPAASEAPTPAPSPATPEATPENGENEGGKICGARAGNTCTDREYCAYQAGQYCGAADASATCKPRPEMCTREYLPVCGCDNKTYGNACTAAAAGQGVLTLGECPPSPDDPIGE